MRSPVRVLGAFLVLALFALPSFAGSLPAAGIPAAELEKPCEKELLPEMANLRGEWLRPMEPMPMSCTGDECGCGVELTACLALCPPGGQPGHVECSAPCHAEYRRCAKACCSP